MGSLFAVPVAHANDPGTLLEWTAARGLHLVTTSARADTEHWTTAYPLPLALLLGGEGGGLPPDLLARGEVRVRIPMVGTAHSLNLAVAAGVLLYEVRRQASR
jgi:TrmH family RNA methyltransferase